MAVVAAAEEPSVAVLAVINLALMIGHLAETTIRSPDSFPAIQSLHLPALRIRVPRRPVADSLPVKTRTSGASGVMVHDRRETPGAQRGDSGAGKGRGFGNFEGLIKLTATREITPYKWVLSDRDR